VSVIYIYILILLFVAYDFVCDFVNAILVVVMFYVCLLCVIYVFVISVYVYLLRVYIYEL